MSTDRTSRRSVTRTTVNPALSTLLRSRLGALLGRRLAVVAYVGRHTGQTHELVVLYRLDGSDVVIRVGRPDHKTWWRNFESTHPLTLRLAGRDHLAQAHVDRQGPAVRVRADLRPWPNGPASGTTAASALSP